jgi:hypothetical protein
MLKKAIIVGALLAPWAGSALADMMPTPDGIAVRPAEIATPTRGMTMQQVSAKFGAPASKIAAVGQPPISRWEYSGFVVYFEGDHVIHCVVSEAAAMPVAAPSPAPSAAPATHTAPAAAPVAAPTTTSDTTPTASSG